MTRGRCSHAWLLYYDQDFECDMVMEAHTEWRLVPFDVFMRKNTIVRIFVPRQSIDGGLKLGGHFLGTRYDVEGAFVGLFLVELFKRFGRKLRNPFRSRRSWFCSEGVVQVLRSARYPGADKLSPSDTTPEDLLKFFERDVSREWQR
jgi:hypothetical protein